MQLVKSRSNRSIFVPQHSASPKDGLFAHISELGQLARLDFERFNVAGEVIFKVDGDAAPTTQQDEEARIGSLAYALKKLGNEIDAAEFIRCLNLICEGGDARYRQVAASHYYREIVERGVGVVLKEMALLAMQLELLTNPNGVTVEEEVAELGFEIHTCDSTTILNERAEKRVERRCSLFELEVEAITRLVGRQGKCSRFAQDDFADWVKDLEENGASVEELDAAFETLEAIDQYTENGAIILMSGFERTTTCGSLDSEFVEEDLPERAKYLAGDLRRAYANGGVIEAIWEDVNAQLDVLYPIKGKTGDGGRFYSHANRELQTLVREILAEILADCQADFHLTALRTNPNYRTFHKSIRGATDTKQVGKIMKCAYEARLSGALPLKHFTALSTAAQLQRGRLKSARLSNTARELLGKIAKASDAKLRFLRWAMYGKNQPQHVIHRLPAQEQERIWEALKNRPDEVEAMTA